NAAGPYLSRPTAAAARNGGVYYATDTLGTFRSDGAAWSLIQQGAPSITSAAMSAAPFTTPYDGQVIDLVVDASAGVIWRLKYRAADASAYKWNFVGGAPLLAAVEALESTTSTSYVDLATPGPSLTLPRSGDYTGHVSSYLGTTTTNAAAVGLSLAGAAPTGDIIYL